jgi:hypothetical protein
MSQLPVVLAVQLLIPAAILLATVLLLSLSLVAADEMSVLLVPLALTLSIDALLLLVMVMVTELAVPPALVMLPAVLQEVATFWSDDKAVGLLIAAHCTLASVTHVPEATTDQLALAVPVAGAVPQVAEVLLHRIRILLTVPCKVLFVCCSWEVCRCRLLVAL